MKKKFLFMALGVSMLGIMTGNIVKADDEVQEVSYSRTNISTEMSGSRYTERLPGHLRVEMELRTHLMRSVLRRNCSIWQNSFRIRKIEVRNIVLKIIS